MTIKAIVFDIGNVLVRWDARLAFLSALGTPEQVDAFLERVDFPTRNLRGDAGETFAELAQEIQDPADRALFASYLDSYALTIPETIEGTWALIPRLAAKGHQIHAITNWSAETWPIGVSTHPRLGDSFGVTVVSGAERVLKPEAKIYATLCERAGLRPEECFFIDDSLKNVEGAKAFGMEAHHFMDPGALEADLVARGLL